MRNPLLAALGLRMYPGAVDAQLCEELSAAMRAADGARSAVYDDKGERPIIDDVVRRSYTLHIADPLKSKVEDAMRTLHLRVERDFESHLLAPDRFDFLRYGPGDRFVAHVDAPRYERGDQADVRLTRRRVSVVLFVNDGDGVGDTGGYEGGNLLIRAYEGADDELTTLGFGLPQAAGTVVAFPAQLWHEVTPVVTGQRLTVVGWFCSTKTAARPSHVEPGA